VERVVLNALICRPPLCHLTFCAFGDSSAIVPPRRADPPLKTFAAALTRGKSKGPEKGPEAYGRCRGVG